MSAVALHSNRSLGHSGFSIGKTSCSSAIFESLGTDSGDRRPKADVGAAAAAAAAVAAAAEEEYSSSSSGSSSIGKNSDDDTGNASSEEGEENEVQSSYKGPLEMMDALEEVLPMRRGISKFYNGKSKSFTSLADASSSPVKEIAKPENAYSRRRRNLLVSSHAWDKNRSFPLRSNMGGISKRPLSSSKSTLALAVAMSNSESYSSASEDSSSSTVSLSRSPPPRLPPRHPQGRGSHNQLASPRLNFSPWRSYSLADLQHCSNLSSSVHCDAIAEKADLEELT